MIFDALFFRQFRRNALLSLVTIAAIALAVAVLTAIQLANASAARAFADADSRLHDRVGIQIVGSAPFDERGIARIAALPGIVAALPITEDTLLVEGTQPEIVRAIGVDTLARLPTDTEFRAQRPGPFSDGGSMQSALFAGAAIVSARLAANAGGGLWVRARGHRVRVAIAGVLAADRAGADSSTVFFDIAAAQRLFGKRGVQAMLIENALPELEQDTNDLLSRMTDTSTQVSFITRKESKSGATETLDIRIADNMGTRSYELFSGGEAFRINLAVRIALSKLLSRRAGAELSFLLIDEGFGSQDAQGRDRLVEAIAAIKEDFQKILVITHIEELKDQFDTRIEVDKGPAGSQITVVRA